jgi:hypothetical protein
VKRNFYLLVLITMFLLASCNILVPGTETMEPAGETATPTIGFTLTPSDTPQPSATFTPEQVLISVSVDTNCRTGPGQVYDLVGGLMVGETAQVIARDPSGHYWYIANPHGPGFCYVWGQYATLVGNTTPLPVFTPLPTPPPLNDFELSFVGIDQCSAMRYTRLKMGNIGVLTWESVKATIYDLTTADVSSPMLADEFTDAYTCGTTTNVTSLAPGASAIMYSYGFNHDLPGHSLRAVVTLCSQDGLVGTCVEHTIDFTP